MLSEIHQLAELRRSRSWTYERLAKAIGLKRTTVYRILSTPNPRIHERTQWKIQDFLAAQRRKTKADREAVSA